MATGCRATVMAYGNTDPSALETQERGVFARYGLGLNLQCGISPLLDCS